jgi:hypothetical protein
LRRKVAAASTARAPARGAPAQVPASISQRLITQSAGRRSDGARSRVGEQYLPQAPEEHAFPSVRVRKREASRVAADVAVDVRGGLQRADGRGRISGFAFEQRACREQLREVDDGEQDPHLDLPRLSRRARAEVAGGSTGRLLGAPHLRLQTREKAPRLPPVGYRRATAPRNRSKIARAHHRPADPAGVPGPICAVIAA